MTIHVDNRDSHTFVSSLTRFTGMGWAGLGDSTLGEVLRCASQSLNILRAGFRDGYDRTYNRPVSKSGFIAHW